MKTFKNLYQPLISEENIIEGLLYGAKHKRHRREVKWSFRNVNNVIERTQEVFQDDYYRFPIHEAKFISNRVLKKNRFVVRPNFIIEQIAQHSIMNLVRDDMLNSMYDFSCGSLPGRGGVYGQKYLIKQIRKIKKNKQDVYCLKLDVKHFFESIPIDMLFNKLENRYKDDRFLLQINKVLLANKIEWAGEIYTVGLPIGYYTSQWLANWYLSSLDHYIKHQLKAKIYVRYVDDLVILHNDKVVLKNIFNKIEEYLYSIGLEVKSNHQIFKFIEFDDKGNSRTVRFIDFLGYKFYHNKTILRKGILKSAKRKAAHIKKKNRITYKDAQNLMSYIGYFSHANCKKTFEEYISSQVNIGACRKIIRKHQYKINKANKIKLDKYYKER